MSVAERNQRLDALLVATEEWGNKRVKELENKVTLVKALLKGHTGTERIAQNVTNQTKEIVVSAIEEFLDAER